MRQILRLMKWLSLVLSIGLVSCARSAPPATQFQLPSPGTLIPGGHEETIHPELQLGQSGALVINQTRYPIQVAVSNTIATLPIGQDFLFILPPGPYEFYIYEFDSAPRIHTEKLEDGKLRYLYISRLTTPDK